MMNFIHRRTGWLVLLAILPLVSAPAAEEGPPPGDSITRGLWWLYHLQYAEAYRIFSREAKEHPADPKGPFYETATDWWELAQNFDLKLPDVERRFFADAKETVDRARAACGEPRLRRAIVEKDPGAQQAGDAHLYWGGAQGLKGRWLVTQKQWMSAYSAGKEGHRHLLKALELNPSLYDANLGLGIYDYYTAVLPGFMGALSKLVMHGDRRRGIRELETAVHQGPHARVEAMVFLIEIYANEEREPAKALVLARQLRQEFPQSAAMQISEIFVLNELHRWKESEHEAQDLLDKALKKENYYSEKDVNTGRYLVGLAALMGDHNAKKCRVMMNPLIDQAAHSPSRWVTFALLRRGQSFDVERSRAKAKADYERVLARPDVWDSHAEANRFLRKAFTFKIPT